MKKWGVFMSRGKQPNGSYYVKPIFTAEANTQEEADKLFSKWLRESSFYIPDGRWTKTEEMK